MTLLMIFTLLEFAVTCTRSVLGSRFGLGGETGEDCEGAFFGDRSECPTPFSWVCVQLGLRRTWRRRALRSASSALDLILSSTAQVSKAQTSVSNIKDMVKLWPSEEPKNNFAPRELIPEHEVTRDFCLVKADNLLSLLGVKTKSLQFRTC